MHHYIYLDNNATTRVDPDVLEAMLPYFSNYFANATSTNHRFGKKAAEAIEKARSNIGELIHCSPQEIIFTSGATEAINLALKGVYKRYSSIGKHIITSKTEHTAVLEVCRYLQKNGAEVTYLSVDSYGHISLQELKDSIREDTILVSLMYANNETGTINQIEEIADFLRERNILFFCDATQAVGKVPISVRSTSIDLMAFSAHKMYGPKGIGALYIKRRNQRIQLEPLILGGRQENNLRAGTLNVPGVVGFGQAALKARKTMQAENKRLMKLRDWLESEILNLEQTFINGSDTNRMTHVSNITIRFLKAEQLILKLNNIAISTGSACATGTLQASHVLTAMGLSTDDAKASVRISLGRFTTDEEIETTIRVLTREVEVLRKESPIWELYKKGIIQ